MPESATERGSVLWAEHVRTELPAFAESGAVVIVPIGSLEQHGAHLPLDTDCRTVTHVAREGALRATDVPALVLPTIPLGVSGHHMRYPGTVTLTTPTVWAVLKDVCESLVAQGFERILILSGHGGNRAAIAAAAQEFKFALDRQIEAACWFDLVEPTIDAIMEGPVHDVGHSGEAETSAILALAPDLVRQASCQLVEGITDDPARGTLHKGRRMLDAAANAVAERIRCMAGLPGHGIQGIETVWED